MWRNGCALFLSEVEILEAMKRSHDHDDDDEGINMAVRRTTLLVC